MLTMISALAPLLLRHIQGYAEVAGADARDAAQAIARELAALLVAAAAGLIALLMLCVLLLALTWDGPWRVWTAAGLAMLFAAVAAACAVPVLRGRHVFFARVRGELGRDRELIERALNGSDESARRGVGT